MKLSLSPGQSGDGPAGRALLQAFGPAPVPGCPLVMDCAYQGNATRRLALALGYTPVVPPNPQRLCPWEYDRVLYRRRNEVERLFRRLKGFRRVFSRFEKLDVMFLAFVHLALIFDALRLREQALGRCSVERTLRLRKRHPFVEPGPGVVLDAPCAI